MCLWTSVRRGSLESPADDEESASGSDESFTTSSLDGWMLISNMWLHGHAEARCSKVTLSSVLLMLQTLEACLQVFRLSRQLLHSV